MRNKYTKYILILVVLTLILVFGFKAFADGNKNHGPKNDKTTVVSVEDTSKVDDELRLFAFVGNIYRDGGAYGQIKVQQNRSLDNGDVLRAYIQPQIVFELDKTKDRGGFLGLFKVDKQKGFLGLDNWRMAPGIRLVDDKEAGDEFHIQLDVLNSYAFENGVELQNRTRFAQKYISGENNEFGIRHRVAFVFQAEQLKDVDFTVSGETFIDSGEDLGYKNRLSVGASKVVFDNYTVGAALSRQFEEDKDSKNIVWATVSRNF